ncbi:hypothetical protein Tsubulata_030162 [Turnera subulata]|uniref:Endonuclease/exonuclease/phosphatase domain-containing protein n=1 Tax=Turnera subulata TaxID=218843 RepID=A0A9Q0G0S5_9ROSI|nr:hypothetical protein Tsubulata_030162 [Turnera subulata]
MVSVLSWNCQGAAKRQFCRLCKEICREERPDIVIVVEPRISGVKAERVIRRLRFPNSHRAEARGYAGGIWVLWDAGRTKVSIVHSHTQFIHFTVDTEKGLVEFTAVYASPQEKWRRYLWDNLEVLARHILSPWFLIGDFNAILDGLERRDARGRNGAASKQFLDCIFKAELEDVGFIGPKFTWKSGNKLARLDRALFNRLALVQFPGATLTHLPRACSDHNPIFLRTEGIHSTSPRSGKFKFLAAWVAHKDFGEFVSNKWDKDGAMPVALTKFVEDVGKWNRAVFVVDLEKQVGV